MPYTHAPRFFVSRDQIRESPRGWAVTMTGDEAYHAVRVLRLKVQDAVILIDGDEKEYLAVLSEIVHSPGDSAGVTVVATAHEVRRSQSEPPFPVTLIQALPKGDKFDQIVQKGTEVGVSQFVPARSQRVVVKLNREKEKARITRWQRIALEAAKQSGRGRVPSIQSVTDVVQAAQAEIDRGALVLFFWENAAVPLKQQLREFLSHTGGEAFQASPLNGDDGPTGDQVEKPGWKRPVSIIIGPEGGFSKSEADCFAEMGCVTVSMGPRLLRTETAGPVAAALVLYELS